MMTKSTLFPTVLSILLCAPLVAGDDAPVSKKVMILVPYVKKRTEKEASQAKKYNDFVDYKHRSVLDKKLGSSYYNHQKAYKAIEVDLADIKVIPYTYNQGFRVPGTGYHYVIDVQQPLFWDMMTESTSEVVQKRLAANNGAFKKNFLLRFEPAPVNQREVPFVALNVGIDPDGRYHYNPLHNKVPRNFENHEHEAVLLSSVEEGAKLRFFRENYLPRQREENKLYSNATRNVHEKMQNIFKEDAFLGANKEFPEVQDFLASMSPEQRTTALRQAAHKKIKRTSYNSMTNMTWTCPIARDNGDQREYYVYTHYDGELGTIAKATKSGMQKLTPLEEEGLMQSLLDDGYKTIGDDYGVFDAISRGTYFTPDPTPTPPIVTTKREPIAPPKSTSGALTGTLKPTSARSRSISAPPAPPAGRISAPAGGRPASVHASAHVNSQPHTSTAKTPTTDSASANDNTKLYGGRALQAASGLSVLYALYQLVERYKAQRAIEAMMNKAPADDYNPLFDEPIEAADPLQEAILKRQRNQAVLKAVIAGVLGGAGLYGGHRLAAAAAA